MVGVAAVEDVVELGYGVAAFNADGHLCALFGINWGREIGGSRQEVVLESYHIIPEWKSNDVGKQGGRRGRARGG